MINTDQIQISTTPTLILDSNDNQKNRIIKNIGSIPLFIGSDDSVTNSNGFPIEVDEELMINDFNGTIYGIVSDDNTDVEVIEDE